MPCGAVRPFIKRPRRASDFQAGTEEDGPTEVVVLIIAVGIEIGEAITILVGQVNAFDRHLDIFGNRIAHRSIDIDRRTIAFKHIAGARVGVDEPATIADRSAGTERAFLIIERAIAA